MIFITSCIPEKPHQRRGFDQCSQKKLSALFDTVVNKTTYSVASYIARSKRSFYNADTAFISIGFSNWKGAAKKFPIHEAIRYVNYKEACLKVIILPSTIHQLLPASQPLQHKVECMQREVAVFFRI